MSYIPQILGALLLIQTTCTYGANITSRLTGGQDAYPGQYPYQVSISYGIPPLIKYRHVCGGSILNEKWILTSAHCLKLIPIIGKIQVKAGKHALNSDNEYVQTSQVALKIINSNYKGLPYLIKPYDIALLKLATPLHINKDVRPVTLSSFNPVPESSAVLTGWGSTSTTILPKPPKVLQYVELKIISNGNCIDALKFKLPQNQITDLQICTGPLDESKTACLGDSGSPLVQYTEDNVPLQIGIVSWSPYPCGASSPTVYTLTSVFLDWIKDRIRENS